MIPKTHINSMNWQPMQAGPTNLRNCRKQNGHWIPKRSKRKESERNTNILQLFKPSPISSIRYHKLPLRIWTRNGYLQWDYAWWMLYIAALMLLQSNSMVFIQFSKSPISYMSNNQTETWSGPSQSPANVFNVMWIESHVNARNQELITSLTNTPKTTTLGD